MGWEREEGEREGRLGKRGKGGRFLVFRLGLGKAAGSAWGLSLED